MFMRDYSVFAKLMYYVDSNNTPLRFLITQNGANYTFYSKYSGDIQINIKNGYREIE